MRRTVNVLAAGFGLLCFQHVFAGDKDAESVVREATQSIYMALEEQCELVGTHPEYLYQLVNQILLPHADLRRMSQWVLGKHWRDLDDAQRDAFSDEFRLLLIRTYAVAIQLASLDEIGYLPTRESARPDRATVRAEIRRPGEPLVTISYSMYENDESWLVYDIAVDGVSLVSNYRTSFADEVRSRGFAGLMKLLQNNNSQPMATSTAEQIKNRSARTCSNRKQ